VRRRNAAGSSSAGRRPFRPDIEGVRSLAVILAGFLITGSATDLRTI
jgi:hypothetical protein